MVIPLHRKPAEEEIPEKLRPYIFHGIDLQWTSSGKEALAECYFCGKENHFSVAKSTGKWQCLSCGMTGNIYSFLLELFPLFNAGVEQPLEELASERGFLSIDVLKQWQVFKSGLVDFWCIPGYNEKEKLSQLYQYRNTPEGKQLLPTPTLGHQMFGLNLFDRKQKVIWVCEGVWDAMALWEVLRGIGDKDNVLAVPGCNVFKEKWYSIFSGHKVCILFDNDHPRKRGKGGKLNQPPGYTGALKVAQTLSDSQKPPASIEILTWGENGYNPLYKSGYDIRDALQTFGEI